MDCNCLWSPFAFWVVFHVLHTFSWQSAAEVYKISMYIVVDIQAVKEFVHHANKMCSLRSILPSGAWH